MTVRKFLVLALLVLGIGVQPPAAHASSQKIVTYQGIALPTINPLTYSFPTRAGWNFPANSAFVSSGIHARGTTNAAGVVPVGHSSWQILRPPTQPGAPGACLSIVQVVWNAGGTNYRGVGAWDHCVDLGFTWFRWSSELPGLGLSYDDGVIGPTYVGRVFETGSGSGYKVWQAELWNYSTSSWVVLDSGVAGAGATDTGTASFRHTWNPSGSCTATPSSLLRGVQVGLIPGGWTDGYPYRTLAPQSGCFPTIWTHSESGGSPNFTKANTP